MSKDEQKKRGGFVPVGDLALDLPGVQVKALRDTMALAQPCGVITRRGRGELQQVQSISDLETWRRVAGPKKEDQWQDGRSAKECARAWLELNPDYVPAEISQALCGHPDLGRILPGWSAEPEARIRFDSCRGEPSNLDVLLTVEDEGGPLVIAVEAKADEPFGKDRRGHLREVSERRAKNPRSQGVARLEQLAAAILGVPGDRLPEVGKLRYQLLTASAAALAEAQRQSAHRTVVIIQEFVTARTSDQKHHDNAKDLNAFVHKLSDGVVATVAEGTVRGPLELPGHALIDSPIQFYIGKVVRNLRSSGDLPTVFRTN